MTPGESGSSNRFERHLQGESGCLKRSNRPRGERLPQGKATAPGEGDSVEESDCPGGEWPRAAVRATTPGEGGCRERLLWGSNRPRGERPPLGESNRPRGERPPQGKTVQGRATPQGKTVQGRATAPGEDSFCCAWAPAICSWCPRSARATCTPASSLLDVVLDGGAHLERQAGVVLRCLHDATAFPAAGEAGGKRNDSAAPRSAQSRALSA